MIDILMTIWFVMILIACIYQLRQVQVGKPITKREVCYFLLGIAVVGIPFICLLIRQGGM